MKIVNSYKPKPLSFTSNMPRYLYHLTPKPNAEQILRSGAHISHPENDHLSGFFMLDFSNFLKHWTNPFKNFSNRLFLVTAHTHNSKELVLLRISTKNLDSNKMRIRSLFSSFHIGGNGDINQQINGESVSRAKHYTRKKHPIEYFYSDTILPENIEKVGECIMDNNILIKMSIGLGNAKELVQQLVKGKPEEKGLTFCKNFNILKRN